MDTTTDRRRIASPRRRGALAAAQMVPAVVPLGLAMGVALAETSVSAPVAWAGAALLLAGASQLAAAAQVDDGTAALAAAAVAVTINLRFAVYGAALAGRFRRQPTWFRWVGPTFVVDQSYALVSDGIGEDAPAAVFRRFYLAAVLLLWGVWQASVVAGVLLGPILPSAVPFELVVPVMFVALAVPSANSRSLLLAATLGAAVALCTTVPPAAVALVAAALGGAVGMISRPVQPMAEVDAR